MLFIRAGRLAGANVRNLYRYAIEEANLRRIVWDRNEP